MVVVQPPHIALTERRTYRTMLMSDLHFGASCTDVAAIKADLETARKHDARILINGDVFDLILPSDRKRYDPRAIVPELQNRANIVNASLDYALDILAPYADLIDLIGIGNHETAGERHHSVDIGALLVSELQRRGSPVQYGGIGGYYRQHWVRPPRAYANLTIRYHHGAGGASPVTKGIIDFARFDRWVSDADVLWIGHKHNRFVDTGVCERLTGNGNVVTEPRLYVMTGAYMRGHVQSPKDAQANRVSTYAQDFNMAPQRSGGVLLEVEVAPSRKYGLTKQVRAIL